MSRIITYLFSCLLALSFLGIFSGQSAAQPVLLREVPVRQARSITTDELGNVYVTTRDNALTQYNASGDSLTSFRNIKNGQLDWVDASNPMKILAYYGRFGKVVLLDKQLSLLNEIDLRKLGLFEVGAIGVASDGNIWLYDNTSAQLLKLDERLQVIGRSNDLRVETQEVPRPSSLLEKEGQVYLCDPRLGVLIFDRYGNYRTTLAFQNITSVQVFGDQILYYKDQALHLYNRKTFASPSIGLPMVPNIGARIERERLYVLQKDRLFVYANNKDVAK